MISKNIKFKNFSNIKIPLKKKLKKIFRSLITENNQLLISLSNKYLDNFDKKKISKYKNYKIMQIFGMGGSGLGTKAIYNFLKNKINKKVIFFDNLRFNKIDKSKKKLNLVISKSGNTLETIVNSNIYINKTDRNIFITEDKLNYLKKFAQELKAEVIHHNNFIGGRYSVLSEVGMLPAELMGLKSSHFRQFNTLVKNKSFMNALLQNVNSTLYFLKNKKLNSIILNYDDYSHDLFYWYQQLIAESLGKKNKGLLPIISSVPKDNHSVMQQYLDGPKNNFFTFFYVRDREDLKINNSIILKSSKFLKNKSLRDILLAQKKATENIFKKKRIPFRSFEIKKRDEKTLGELFCFFILETILVARSININPFNQPAVELIKTETKKLLV